MATLKQIQSRIEKLQAQAENLLARRTAVVIGEIHSMMEKHGLTLADLDAHVGRAKTRGPKAGASRAAAKAKGMTATGKLPAKYLNPQTGATWSGYARPPAWIKEAKDRSVFLIDKAAAGAEQTKKSGPKKTAVVKKTEAAKRTVQRKTVAKHAVARKKVKNASRVKRQAGVQKSATA